MSRRILRWLAAALALGLGAFGWACRGDGGAQLQPSGTFPMDYNREEPLLFLADSLEEAQAVGAQYGITLLSYDFGLAVYGTQENPMEVIRRGREQGWPELSLNITQDLYQKPATHETFPET